LKTSDFIKRLDIRFDLYALKRDWWNLEESGNQGTLPSTIVSTYLEHGQIGLTHTKDCKEDSKWQQGVGSLFWDERTDHQSLEFTEKDFSVVNIELKELCPYWWKVCNEMKSQFSIGRIRIMTMKPQTVYKSHHDFERRWHIPIIAPRDSFYYVRTNEINIYNDDILESSHGIGFHMPDDGFVYEIEAGHWHTAVNPSHGIGGTGGHSTENLVRVHMMFDAAL
jgi:hypothetical protein